MSQMTESLKHKLKVVAGLPPWGEPTDEQLELIIQDILEIARRRAPTEADWKEATERIVPHAGTYKYAGEDMSNLNMLLQQILDQRAGSGPTGTVRK